jgi:FkbM family methyltransferase
MSTATAPVTSDLSSGSGLFQWLADLWRELVIRFRFKFVIPRVQYARIEGIKLDVSTLSPLMKNNIMEGRYEVQERRLAQRFLREDDRVLELGGALGFIGLYCYKHLGIRFYATVEANPKTVELLKHNYLLNDVPPRVIHAAAAREDGYLDLDVGSDFWCNSVVTRSSSATTVKVPAMSLASILAKLGFQPTALVVDIEGAESLLDYSALPSSVTRVIMELHPDIIGNDEVQRIKAELAGRGFHQREEQDGTHLFTR